MDMMDWVGWGWAGVVQGVIGLGWGVEVGIGCDGLG